jgi:hypothetical protein
MTPRFLIWPVLASAIFIAQPASAGEASPFTTMILEQDFVRLYAGRTPAQSGKTTRIAPPTNQCSGLVLDLRFADGDTNVSAADIPAGRNVPLVILVNGQTRGPAADLAAKLRADGRAVIIGDTNFTGKVTPDITVSVPPKAEKSYFEDPFSVPADQKTAASTDLLPFIDHTSEAELVRRRVKDGDDVTSETPRDEPAQSVIYDPALARAVDLLKALTALHKQHG